MTRRRWVAAGVRVLLVLVGVFAVLAWREMNRVFVCDAWSFELRDGTVVYAPGYDEVEIHAPYGPCWTLPAGVTREDIGY